MNKHKTAIIIGSGIGGITTSIFLAQKGYSVRVYEKNGFPGGRCSKMVREGHRFDLGATIYLMPRVYEAIFETLGFSHKDLFKPLPLTTLYKIYFEDGFEFAFSSDEDNMKKQLEQVEKGSYKKMQKLKKDGYKLFELAMRKLIGRNFLNMFEFATLRNAILLIKLKTYIKHTAYIKRFFRNKHLQTVFTFQNIYVGQNPYKAPALFSMIPSAELTEGSLFPYGGMGSITENLVAKAEELGVQFIFNEPVVEIKTLQDSAEGIVLQNGNLERASVIVANADLPYVYRELLPVSKQSKRIDNMNFSCSAIVFHWGLDKVYEKLSHHNVFISNNYRENLNAIFNDHAVGSRPSFYIHAPVRSDVTAAPDGHDTLSVIVPAGHVSNKNQQNWNELKKTVRKSIIERLKTVGLNDIEEHIKFEICYLPQTWQNIFNLSKGATFGSIGHSIMQMGYFRPHNKHATYKNLYFTGGSTHPGNGIPLVLMSAKLTSERIINDLKHE